MVPVDNAVNEWNQSSKNMNFPPSPTRRMFSRPCPQETQFTSYRTNDRRSPTYQQIDSPFLWCWREDLLSAGT